MSVQPRSALRLFCRIAALTSLAVTLLSLAPASRGDDLLDRVKSRNEIAAQKLEAEVREALADAQRNSASDPAGSAERLKRVLANLEADRALTQARRDLLTRQIKDRIRTAEAEAAKAAPRPANADPAAGAALRTREAEQRAAEVERIHKSLDQINTLQKDGKTGEASRLAEDLFRRYPALATPAAAGKTTSMFEQVAALQASRSESVARRTGALSTIERSAMMPAGDVDFPRDWAAKIKMRPSTTTAHLSAREKELLQALSTEIPVDYQGVNFQDVIKDISTKIGKEILLDNRSLAEAGINSETLVNLSLRSKITGRTALRKVLGDFGLAYIIKDENIQVVTERMARESMVTRTYFLGSLLQGGAFSNAGIRFVPGLSQFEAMQNVMSIINMIQTTVDPSSWQVNGGMGTISFNGSTMSLTIRNNSEVHGAMGGMLR